jgi:hypothetical protein
MKDRNISAEEAENLLEDVDKGRDVFTKKLSGYSRYDCRNYDLVLDVTDLSIDQAVGVICYIVNL